MRHHALREERGKRLGKFELANMFECARPKTGIEQMQNRVLDAADILFHRKPLSHFLRIKRSIIGLACKAQEIPRAIDKSVERIGLACRLSAAFGTASVLPSRMTQQRIARLFEIDIFGQGDRQLILGNGDYAACLAMDEGDRRPPIALA